MPNTKIYMSITPNTPYSLTHQHNYLTESKKWLHQNFLQLNNNKTDMLITDPHYAAEQLKHELGALTMQHILPET